MPAARLILYTGLGVSRELLQRQRGLPLALEMPAWIDPLRREPLEAYARRMSLDVTRRVRKYADDPDSSRAAEEYGPSRVRSEPGVVGDDEMSQQDDVPLFLGGVSFGAMVALEVARHVPGIAGVFLLSGALTGRAISPLLQPLARSMPYVPLALGLPILKMSPLLYPLLGVSRTPDRRALDQVLPRASPALFRWGAWAAATWDPPALPAVPIHHIHGGSDLIIPVQRVRADVIVKGAGHLLNLTHADAVNAFIMSRIQDTLKRGTA
ncbi:MAG TPA: alpha/beta hydrolase [Tepidisphaeraceae bacterium]|nr:alpha/beta hydrolase [Tepidisphaeraceae bacterium]